MSDIAVGQPAPDFTLPTDGGGSVTLSDLKGKAVVVYFYPKDDTPGCTAEAIAFTALADSFAEHDAVVIGISPDTAKAHDRFKAKYELTIVLAADAEKEAAQKYGVWVKKSRYGREYMGVERTTFLVDRDGKIAEIWNKVKVDGHAEAVLESVKGLG